MTIAQDIAVRFRNDGQCFESDGMSIYDACNEHCRHPDYQSGLSDAVRYTFRDGSVLTIAGAAWDLGYRDCYCMRTAGHTSSCAMIRVYDGITDTDRYGYVAEPTVDEIRAYASGGYDLYISDDDAQRICDAILRWDRSSLTTD